MTTLEKLRSLEDWLTHLGAGVVPLLRPGLSDSTISLTTSNIVMLPDALTDVYRWHDGSTASEPGVLGDLYIVPGWILPPLAEAIATYREGVVGELWPEGYFPLLTTGVGDHLLFNTRGDMQGYLFFRDEPELDLMYLSLDRMLDTWLACFEKGIYRLVAGMLEPDLQAEAEVAAAMNPGVEHWGRDV